MRRAWTTEETERACRLYAEGIPTKVIAGLMDRSPQAVRSIAKRHGVRKGKRWDRVEDEILLAWKSLLEVADGFQRSADSTRKRRQRLLRKESDA